MMNKWPVEFALAEDNAIHDRAPRAGSAGIAWPGSNNGAEGWNPLRILLVEDNPGDVRLAVEALRDWRVPSQLSVVGDGVEALAFLHKQSPYASAARPDLILLDLNLPRKDGREVLEELKTDPWLKSIPVVVLTTSDSEADVSRAYDLNANCYITKPAGLEQFVTAIKSIQYFWSALVRLPDRS